MTSERPTCGAKGTINRWGKPCRSPFISKVTGLCRSHDPGQVNRVQEQRSRGGHRSRSSRLSKRMQRLVQLLFGDVGVAPTLDRIEPKPEYADKECETHILRIEGQRALLDNNGPNGMLCLMSWPCNDKSLFAQAMRILRIYEGTENGEQVFRHGDTNRIIPQSEIARVTRLVQERT